MKIIYLISLLGVLSITDGHADTIEILKQNVESFTITVINRGFNPHPDIVTWGDDHPCYFLYSAQFLLKNGKTQSITLAETQESSYQAGCEDRLARVLKAVNGNDVDQLDPLKSPPTRMVFKQKNAIISKLDDPNTISLRFDFDACYTKNTPYRLEGFSYHCLY